MLNRLHLTNFCAAVRSTDLLAAGWNSPTPRLVLVQYLAGSSLVQYVPYRRYCDTRACVAGFLKGMFDSSLALCSTRTTFEMERLACSEPPRATEDRKIAPNTFWHFGFWGIFSPAEKNRDWRNYQSIMMDSMNLDSSRMWRNACEVCQVAKLHVKMEPLSAFYYLPPIN